MTKYAATTGVGLFIPLPEELAKQFPSLAPTDDSPPHVTFLYVGSVPQERKAEFLAVLKKVFSQIRGGVTGHLMSQDQDYFLHPDKARQVAYIPVRFSQDMAKIRWSLREALVDAGFEVLDAFPLNYRPHVTLEYIPGFSRRYKGVVPQGSWDFNSIEVWGMSGKPTIPFGTNARLIGRDLFQKLARRVAERWLRS